MIRNNTLKTFFIFLITFNTVSYAEIQYLSEESIEDVWTVDVLVIDNQPEGVIASVNGKITHGDKLRIKVPTKNSQSCNFGHIFTTFYTTINNPNISELKDMVIPATVKDEKVNLKIEKVNLKVIDSVKAMLGDLVFIDLGWNDIESIKRYFQNREQLTIELQNGADIKALDYFDIPKNSFVLDGFNSALNRAKNECLRIVKENDKIKSELKITKKSELKITKYENQTNHIP